MSGREQLVKEQSDSSVEAGALDRLNVLMQQYGSRHSLMGTDAATPGILSRVKRRIVRWLLKEQFVDDKPLNEVLYAVLHSLNEIRHQTTLKNFEVQEFRARDLEQHFENIHSSVQQLRNAHREHEHAVEQFSEQLKQLDGVCRGLESIIVRNARSATLQQVETESDQQRNDHAVESGLDYSYVLLENRFRGSEEEVRRRLVDYVPRFAACTSPVLEIGAGRGELQVLFQEAGIKSYGLELDHAMVEACQEKNLQVTFGDGISHLRELEDNSLGGVIAIQVIEHLPLVVLEELLALCNQKLCKGGVLLLETINTSSLLALAHNYFRDPTHAQPLHPDTMRYLAEQAGLEVREIVPRSAYPQEAQLQSIAEQVYYPERWRPVIEGYNHSIAQLNAILFGHQDYAILAQAK